MGDPLDEHWYPFRSLLARGPVAAVEAAQALGISQPTFSRLVKAWGHRAMVSERGGLAKRLPRR